MATIAAQITETGIIAPDYADIFAQLQNAYWSIYGTDAILTPDSQDGQLLAVFAQAIYDCNQVAVAVYNSFSPATAQGVGLSQAVKINGIARQVPTNSTAVVTITGVAGTVINNGVVGDNLNQNTRWNLPATVTIPPGGEVDATATCAEEGSVAAGSGVLTEILTPTRGWQSVTNDIEATMGSPVEADATLRQRQSASVALASQSLVEGVYAAVANVDGVSRATVYENDSDVTDSEGVPSHSIAVVVEGGDVDMIAQAIALEKPPGTGTYGTTSVVVVDSHGVPNTINFFVLDPVPLEVVITIQARLGYTSVIGDQLQQQLVDFINALAIGEDSYLSRLYSPANLGGVGDGATYVVTSITQAKVGDPQLPANVVIAFNEAAVIDRTAVTLVVV